MLDISGLEERMALLDERGLLRQPVDDCLRVPAIEVSRRLGVPFVDASSNDYLGYASGPIRVLGLNGPYGTGGLGQAADDLGLKGGHGCGWDLQDLVSPRPVSRETTAASGDADGSSTARTTTNATGTPSSAGSGASRLLGGTKAEHIGLEDTLARWVGQEAALLFSSGYAANVGLLSALPDENDVILSDSLNHASIIDGCRLSRAKTIVFPHKNIDALRECLRNAAHYRHRYVVSESYFSMDADTPNLPRMKQVADEFAATLILDEAHALGIYGQGGAGLAQLHGVQPDITVGTLGKAVGTQGAFVAGPNLVRKWLWNRARSFVYSTATSPALAVQTQFHVKHIQGNDPARRRLHSRADELRRLIQDLQLPTPPDSHGPIIPIILGTPQSALAAAHALGEQGILALPVRPPTVPEGTARLRLTVSAGMSDEAFHHISNSIALCLRN